MRAGSPGLLSLPWHVPLSEWDPTEVALREVPVGPSRHLVRFVESDGRLFAAKEMPFRLVEHEYRVLTALRREGLPAVAPIGAVDQRLDADDNGVLITEYLQRSWQYRRLFLRLPASQASHRERLLDSMAGLLVDLHRNGVFWGDCSLANTLFTRDGQWLKAHLVDAETAELHPGGLSTGQRRMDLAILVENVAGGLIDIAARLGGDTDDPALVDDAASVARRYQALWDELHSPSLAAAGDRFAVEARIRRLNDLGFAVDEVRVEQGPDGAPDQVQITVAVAGRRFHSDELRRRTGLEVSDGQATILLNDLNACRPDKRSGAGLLKDTQARAWMAQVLQPGVDRITREMPWSDPVQTFCDLLEVRWLLSEQQGRDVGDDVALAALKEGRSPRDSAAEMGAAEAGPSADELADGMLSSEPTDETDLDELMRDDDF